MFFPRMGPATASAVDRPAKISQSLNHITWLGRARQCRARQCRARLVGGSWAGLGNGECSVHTLCDYCVRTSRLERLL